MPVKINGVQLDNIQVNGADVKKVGVGDRPVFLKIDNNIIYYSDTNIIVGSTEESAPFFKERSKEGVNHFTLALKGKKLHTSSTITEIDLYIVVRMEVLDPSEYSSKKEFLIHIQGSDLSALTATIQLNGITLGTQTIDIDTKAMEGTHILSVFPGHDGNSIFIRIFNQSGGTYVPLTDPKTWWYVEGDSGSPKYTVYAYGDTAIYQLTSIRSDKPLKFL